MIACVLVEITNINVDKTFKYLIPQKFINKIKKGIRVRVPFNNRIIEGFVIDIINHDNTDYVLKEIVDCVDEDAILTDELINLGLFMKEKYYSSLMSCYQCMLPKALKAKHNININKKYIKYITLNNDIDFNYNILNNLQKKIIDIVRKELKVTKTKLNEISTSSVKTLLKKGIIIEQYEEIYRLEDNFTKLEKSIILNEEQKIIKFFYFMVLQGVVKLLFI